MARRGQLKRGLLGCGMLVGLALAGVVGFGVWLGTGGGNRWLQGQLEARLSDLTDGGQVEIGSLDLHPLTGVHVRDLVLRGPSGDALVQVDQLVSDLDPWLLLEGRVVLPHARVQGVRVHMTADEAGEIDLVRLFGPPGEPSDEPFSLPVGLDLPDIELEGVQVIYDTPDGTAAHLAGLRGTLSLEGRDTRISVDDLILSGQLAVPGPVAVVVRGDVDYDGVEGLALHDLSVRIPHGRATASGTVGDEIDLGIEVEQLAALALEPLAGGTLVAGDWEGSLVAKGPPSDLSVTASLGGTNGSRGELAATATVDLQAEELAWSGDVVISELHLEDLLPTLGDAVVLDGVLGLKGQGTSYPDALQVQGTFEGGEQDVFGQQIDAVDAAFGLRYGVLRVEPSRVQGIVGALELAGEVDLVHGPYEIEVDGTLEPAQLADLGAEGLDAPGTLLAAISGDLQGDGRIVVDGTVRYAPFLYGDGVRVDRLSVPFHAVVEEGDVRVEASLDGAGASASGATAATLTSRDLSVDVPAGGDVTLDGTFALSEVAVGEVATAGRVEALVDVEVRDEGPVVDALLALEDYTLAGRPGTDGDAGVTLAGDDVRFDVTLRDYGREVVQTAGRYGLSSARLDLARLELAPTPRSTWTLQGPGHLTVVDGGVADVRLVLDSNLGKLSVEGDLRTEGPLDATVRVEGLQLDVISELYPDRVAGLAGVLDLGLELGGTGEQPVIDAQVDAEDLFLEESVRYLDVRGGLRVADGVLEPALDLEVADAPFAVLTGRVPLEEGGLASPAPDLDADSELSLAIVPGSLERLKELAPALDEQDVPAGQLSAVIEASGPLNDPTLHLAGVIETQVEGWDEPGRLELELDRRASELTWRSDLREGFEARASVDGTGATRLGDAFAWALSGGEEPDLSDPTLYLDDMDVAAVLLGVPVDSLAALADVPVQLAGDLVGGFVVTGSPMEPRAEGAVNWLDPEIGGEALQGAYAAITATEGGYDVQANLAFEQGGLDVAGRVPVVVDLEQDWQRWSAGELDLAVDGVVPLAVASAFYPDLRAAEGDLLVDAEIGGTLAAPEPRYVLAMADGTAVLRELGLKVEDIDLTIEGDHEQARLELALRPMPTNRFQAGAAIEAGDPRIRVEGTTGLSDWVPTGTDARISLRDGAWLVSTDDTLVRLDGDVTLTGDWPALHADGDLAVVQAKAAIDAAAFLDAAPLEPDPRLVIHRGGEQALDEEEADEPPVYADFDVDVRVDLNRNVELNLSMPFVDQLGALGAAVSRVDLATRLGGNVELALVGGEPGLVGEVDLLEGKVRMLRSTFELTDGTISFTGGDPYEDALLDINAEMSLPTASLRMSIAGTPTDPEIEFSSDEYPDRTQQMAMLLTGRAPDELSAQEGEGATQALAELLFTSLFAGQSVGTFSIDPDGAVRLGVPVSEFIYVATTLKAINTDPTENTVSAEAEWTLLPHVVAAGGAGDRVLWADIFWETRF